MAQKYRVYQVRTSYEAGAAVFRKSPEGETIHKGVGWFHPFGQSWYEAGKGFPQEEGYTPEKFFSKYWDDTYDTRLFCIYHMKDGDIYAYDGMFAVRDESDVTRDYADDEEHLKPPIRRDVLVNVVVGGTGAYEGAAGLLMGTTEAGGEIRDIDGNKMPDSIMKLLEGYIKVPVKE